MKIWRDGFTFSCKVSRQKAFLCQNTREINETTATTSECRRWSNHVPPAVDFRQVFQLALEEYKIIQSKIDNIGEFSQKVRSWSLTVTAGILAASATKEHPAWFALASVVTTIFFKLADDYQKRLQGVLIRRVLRIEQQFKEIMPPWVHSGLEGLPHLANTIRDQSMEEGRSKYVWWPFKQGLKGTKKRLWHNKRRLVWRSEYYFYWAQCLFAVLACGALLLWRPTPISYQAEVTAVLRGITNTPAWRGSVQTNVPVIQSAPPITNSVLISTMPTNSFAPVLFPGSMTNVVFSGNPTTSYVTVRLVAPLTNLLVLTNALTSPTGGLRIPSP